jgi:hypothetical protein
LSRGKLNRFLNKSRNPSVGRGSFSLPSKATEVAPTPETEGLRDLSKINFFEENTGRPVGKVLQQNKGRKQEVCSLFLLKKGPK